MTPRQALQDIIDLVNDQIAKGKLATEITSPEGRALAKALENGASALKTPDFQVLPDPKMVALVQDMDQRPMDTWTTPEIKTLHSFALLASSAATLSKENHLGVDTDMNIRPMAAQELVDMVRDMNERDVSTWEPSEMRAVHGLASMMLNASELSQQNLPMEEASSGLSVETLIKAAVEHGSDAEPDQEIEDLQDYLRSAWGVLTESQKTAVFLLPSVQKTYENSAEKSLSFEAESASRPKLGF